MTSGGGARSRVRAALTAEILDVAREHLARDGAAALSLRAVARDLHLVPSALYRYYPGRDALLSALILDGYASLAQASEAADPGPAKSGTVRWVAVCDGIRAWALSRPHEWSLLFGSPVPGYQAPEETVLFYARIATALTAPVRDAHDAGRLALPELMARTGRVVNAATKPVADGLLPGLPPAVAAATLLAWEQLVGAVSLEVFGHWRNTVLDPGALFAHTARQTAALVGLG
ncbi:MAG TPA: TetR/AcrR family transcriptional regulator [Mycobacteriales bacterium]|nr:TetR/AcrR family transcriptional regulator [Mycobacteriales bacterium]